MQLCQIPLQIVKTSLNISLEVSNPRTILILIHLKFGVVFTWYKDIYTQNKRRVVVALLSPISAHDSG